MSEKRNKASNEIVLGYWQALDFMHVGSFPGADDALGDGWCIVEAQLHGEDDLLVLLDDKLQEEVLSARKTTVFLGSVDRDWCISMLAGKLGNASENMGFSDDSKVTIALMSFQLDESHKFIAGTYRLAPVIYATIRLEDDAEIGSSAFNVKSYLSDMRNMERRFFSNDPVDMAQLSKLYDMLAEQDEHYHDRVSCVLSTLDDVPGPFPGLGDQGFGEDIAYLLKKFILFLHCLFICQCHLHVKAAYLHVPVHNSLHHAVGDLQHHHQRNNAYGCPDYGTPDMTECPGTASAEESLECVEQGEAPDHSSMNFPFSSLTLMSPWDAIVGSWVTKIRDVLRSSTIWNKSFSTSLELSWSRFPVGSSARSRTGLFTNALATATRCLSPPESLDG